MQQFMRSMDLVPFLFVVGFLLVAAAIIIFAGLHARRRASLIKATPTSNIGMALDGYREVEGTIEAIPGPQVIAPLTLTPCAWYHALLEEWKRSTGERSGQWHTVRELTSQAPILLRDSTGACLVDPYMAELTPTDKSQWTGDSAAPTDRNPPRLGPSQSTTPVLQVHGVSNSRFRYSEERIYVGDPLLVLGEFSTRHFDPTDDDEDEDLDANVDDTEISAGDDRADPSRTPEAAEETEDDSGRVEDIGNWDDTALVDELTARAKQLTQACIQRGSGKQPFIVTTTPQATHIYMTDIGSQAALYLAAAPLALVALLLYARYG